MGLFRRKKDEPVDPEERSPVTGLKYKDIQLLGVMQQHGADLSQPRHVLHYSYFPSRAQASAAAQELEAAHWLVEVKEPLPDYPDQWLALAQMHGAVLSLDFVRESTDLFERVAVAHGGDYDGWEAST